jgi:hypothetical protein
MSMDSHTDVIEAFGGQVALAKAIGLPPAQACHWRERGIPAKHWGDVEDLARAADLPITARLLKALPRIRHDDGCAARRLNNGAEGQTSSFFVAPSPNLRTRKDCM